MVINNPTFFIGYDSKEDIAYRVCKQSLLNNSSIKENCAFTKGIFKMIRAKNICRPIPQITVRVLMAFLLLDSA